MSTFYNENDRHAAAWLRELAKGEHITDGVVDERSIKELTGDDLAGYNRVHLFAGIGGWDYALKLAGWPEDAEVWTGSCPCQPFSSAGKRQGVADDRHLWPDMFRLIRERRPATIFGEQAARGAGCGWLDGVAGDLEGIGYSVGAAILSASAANAPHRRDRLWFVADSVRGERREKPHGRTTGRVGRQQQLLPWNGGWPSALARFRAMGDGLPRCVEGTDAARNAIVPQVAAAFITAFMEAR